MGVTGEPCKEEGVDAHTGLFVAAGVDCAGGVLGGDRPLAGDPTSMMNCSKDLALGAVF